MTFDLDAATAARRAAADALARDHVAPAAGVLDREHTLADAVRHAARAVLPVRPDEAYVDWVVVLESLAVASPAVAFVAAGDALGVDALHAQPQWAGCRGVDIDGLRSARREQPAWHLAVSAVLVGSARAAVSASVAAIREARSAGASADAVQPAVADAATAVDASRLLLWDAARQTADGGGAVARSLARVHVLETVRLALTALEPAVGVEACRPGTTIDRLRRDATTAAMVLGDGAAERDAAATGTLSV